MRPGTQVLYEELFEATPSGLVVIDCAPGGKREWGQSPFGDSPLFLRSNLGVIRKADQGLKVRLPAVLRVGMHADRAPEVVVRRRHRVDGVELLQRRADAQRRVHLGVAVAAGEVELEVVHLELPERLGPDVARREDALREGLQDLYRQARAQ